MKLSRRERKKQKIKNKETHVSGTEHVSAQAPEKKKVSFIRDVYENQYKKLLIIPFLLLFLAIAQISFQVVTTGDFIHKGVSLKGGITVTISQENDWNIIDIQNFLSQKFSANDINVRLLTELGKKSGVAIEADIQPDDANVEGFISAITEKTGVSRDEFSIESIGSSLGASFFRETIKALITAFIFMGVVVFFCFKVPAPSMAVILAAFSDIVVTIAVVNIIGIKLSTAGIAALLMLIGYSVDTDILLSTRVLKREGELMDKIYGAIKTGLTMTITTIVAVAVGLAFAKSDVMRQIMLIILIGLFADIIMTWIQNVGLLRLYLEGKGNKADRSSENVKD